METTTIKLVIAGSRTITDEDLIAHLMNRAWATFGPYTVISGTARGVDAEAAAIARAINVEVEDMPADWDKYGKSAGYKRNEQMARAADAALIIWDGRSRGAQHMARIAAEAGLPTVLVQVQGSAIWQVSKFNMEDN